MAMAAGKQISVAPMMDVTDRHCRYFLRQISPHVRLYTEMITAQAILHGDQERLLAFDPAEHPLAVQLGGHDPAQLAAAARIAAARGYDEINLNVGCPSDRVRDGRFGACLMLDAELVARCVAAMAEAAQVPVTVKTRIGVDDHDSYEFLAAFVERVARAGCGTFIVHARKAILQGLSPRENREVPPLLPERVHRLKREFPALRIIINGGIASLERIDAELALLDGVMLGRKVAGDPSFLAAVEARFFASGDDHPAFDRDHVVRRMCEYAQRQAGSGLRLHQVTRHMLGLYHGLPGARGWRRLLSEQAGRPGAQPQLLLESLDAMGMCNQA